MVCAMLSWNVQSVNVVCTYHVCLNSVFVFWNRWTALVKLGWGRELTSSTSWPLVRPSDQLKSLWMYSVRHHCTTLCRVVGRPYDIFYSFHFCCTNFNHARINEKTVAWQTPITPPSWAAICSQVTAWSGVTFRRFRQPAADRNTQK